MLAGGALFGVGIVAGLVVTGLGLLSAFSAIEHADPVEKASQLSQAISTSQAATITGFIASGCGVVVFLVGLTWMLIRHQSERVR